MLPTENVAEISTATSAEFLSAHTKRLEQLKTLLFIGEQSGPPSCPLIRESVRCHVMLRSTLSLYSARSMSRSKNNYFQPDQKCHNATGWAVFYASSSQLESVQDPQHLQPRWLLGVVWLSDTTPLKWNTWVSLSPVQNCSAVILWRDNAPT